VSVLFFGNRTIYILRSEKQFNIGNLKLLFGGIIVETLLLAIVRRFQGE
jgi:hypothetical protein